MINAKNNRFIAHPHIIINKTNINNKSINEMVKGWLKTYNGYIANHLYPTLEDVYNTYSDEKYNAYNEAIEYLTHFGAIRNVIVSHNCNTFTIMGHLKKTDGYIVLTKSKVYYISKSALIMLK